MGSPRSPPSPEPMGGLSSPTATAMVKAKRQGGKGGSKKGPGTEGGKLLWDMLAEEAAAPPPAAAVGGLQAQLQGAAGGAAAGNQRNAPSAASLEAALSALGLDGGTEQAVRAHLEGMAGGQRSPAPVEGKAEHQSSPRPMWR